MPTAPIVKDSVEIVLKGNFAPASLSPAWFLHQGIIGQAEHDAAEVEVISPEVASFTCAWLTCKATHDTLALSTTEVDEFERVRDALVATVATLQGTPTWALGINRSGHLAFESDDEVHRIGDRLAPKEYWSGLMEFAGTKSLTMWGFRPGDDASGRIHVTVEPSEVVELGVFVLHNDHYELAKQKSTPATRSEAWKLTSRTIPMDVDKTPVALEVLRDDWDSSMKRAENTFAMIAQLSKEEP